MQGIPHYRDQHFDKLKAAAAPRAVVCFRNVSSSLPCGFFSAVFFFYILFYLAVGFFLLLQVPAAAAAAGLNRRLHSVRICVWCSINRIVTWCWPIIHSYQRKLRGWIEQRSLLAQIAPVDWPARAEAPPEWWWVVAIRAPNGHLRTLRVQTEPVCGAWECELVQPFSTGRYGLALTWPCLEAHTCAGIVQNSRVLVVIKGD